MRGSGILFNLRAGPLCSPGSPTLTSLFWFSVFLPPFRLPLLRFPRSPLTRVAPPSFPSTPRRRHYQPPPL